MHWHFPTAPELRNKIKTNLRKKVKRTPYAPEKGESRAGNMFYVVYVAVCGTLAALEGFTRLATCGGTWVTPEKRGRAKKMQAPVCAEYSGTSA